jgi:hypothetical protein
MRGSGGDVVARANAGKQMIAAGPALTGTSEDTTQGDRLAATVKVRPPETIRNHIIEECAAVAQRWSDEAAEFNDPRSEVQANVCRNLAKAIRGLALSPADRGSP